MKREDLDKLDNEFLLLPDEVATLFGMLPVTITRWARADGIKGIKIPGGHWRFKVIDVKVFYDTHFDKATAPPNW